MTRSKNGYNYKINNAQDSWETTLSGDVDDEGCSWQKVYDDNRCELPNKTDVKKDQEGNVKNMLTCWLESNGCTVYWEKQNPFKKPVFKTIVDNIGTIEKPDLLIERETNGCTIYYAIEVKNGASSGNVYDSFTQLLNYSNKNMGFLIGSEHINVDYFLAATQFSLRGCLFPDDVMYNPLAFSQGRMYAITKGELPPNEYMLTEEYVRLLWRTAKYLGIEKKIGVLLSTYLCGDVIPKPLVQFMEINGTSGKQNVQIWRA